MAETREFVIPYPAQYESDVVLRDGSTLRFRPIRPDDAEALLALHDRLSRQSQKFRFFGLAASYAGEVSRLLQADHDNEFVLVAEAGKRLIGAATYVRDPAQVERAEVSFAIADAVQGRGVGTRMLEMLASIARDHHIQTFEAYVLSDNDRMMRVFLDSGFEVQRRLEGGIFHVVLSLVPTARYEDTAAARSHVAATASMKTFFEPRTVAVIGANRERGKIGSEILHNLVGLLHANMAVYYAYADRAPVFIIGATGPMDETKRRPRIDWIHTALVQGEAVRAYTKWDYQPTVIGGVPESFARAYAVMMSEPRGPVYMCYDAWLQEQKLDHAVAMPPAGSAKVPSRIAADPAALAMHAARIRAAL